jgi:hypothetical protein
MTRTFRYLGYLALASCGLAGSAHAGLDFNWDGFVRSETAFKATDKENPFNLNGDIYIGKTYTGPAAAPNPANPAQPVEFTIASRRGGQLANNSINMQIYRLELESQLKFNQSWTLQAKLRGIVDPGWYDNYSPGQVDNGAISADGGKTFVNPYPNGSQIDKYGNLGNPGNLYTRPNYFKYNVDNKQFAQPLEWAGKNYQVYFPALFLDYNEGPLDVRLGMQQIAWGQALFFRVLDVPDGLDLRRHSALDLGAEEFSDKRVPAPALRVNYQITDDILADAFIQKFQPSVYSNPNTPYNVIFTPFSVRDKYAAYNSRGDYGLRLKGQFGDFSLQAIAVHRWNPDGVFKWDSAQTGPVPGTAFLPDASGTGSAQEWFQYASASRLNGVTGLDTVVNDFPGAQALGAWPVTTLTNSGSPYGPGVDVCGTYLGIKGAVGNPHSKAAYDCATRELNLFFSPAGLGPLRGYIDRDYRAENDFGGGIGYVISAEPGSLLDQLIINVEATYTPNRTFTNVNLDPTSYIHKHEWTTALVLEKYQRFFINLPATYMVFQWEHRTQSDIYGRYSGSDNGGGMGGSDQYAPTGQAGGNNYLVFAFQQPFPNLIWRFDFSALGDVRGGVLLQPALRWKPNGNWTLNAFYNYLNGHLGSPNNNIISTVDYDKEVTIRIGYQF